ncbi:MAG: exonuclease SbcCD subunit D C-terminal domain-containing protein [Deltaproteobacteria bacterium]|nr:exonuclease SbcCD subunit D C-terminal domain-containing protein [Deltaproteobacteria bacterium]
MRILHTADWHLGHHLFGLSREPEHQAFLDWLLEVLVDEEVDALIIAGDIFDASSPSPGAQKQYYRFLARCRTTIPDLNIFVVGGNHDSPLRLDAPKDILDGLGIQVVGGLPRAPDGSIDLERAILPIWQKTSSAAQAPPDPDDKTDDRTDNKTNDKTAGGWLLAVPFLRPRDQLPRPTPCAPSSNPSSASTADSAAADSAAPASSSAPAITFASQTDPHEDLIRQHRTLYATLVDLAEKRRRPGQPLVATGHLYMANTVLSELSERKIQVGNQYALPADIFPEACAYVALGHLHRAQTVANQSRIRYSGSPIPLSMAERNYEHQVYVVEFQGEHLTRVRSLRTPQSRRLLSVPEQHAPLESVLDALRALRRPPGDTSSAPELDHDHDHDHDDHTTPKDAAPALLEVRVQLDHAHPRLRRDIEAAIEGAAVRLVRIDVRRPERHANHGLPEGRDLTLLSPEDVFQAAYHRARGVPVPANLMASFAALLTEIQVHSDEPSALESHDTPESHDARADHARRVDGARTS